MKKLFFIMLAWAIGFVSLSFAWNEFTYENAKKIANEYIANSRFDENWKDKHPTLVWEGKYFYTDSKNPSYIEFKVTCDTNPDCGFIMVNFDGDDVAIPIAATSGNTPSEVLAAKNESKQKENTLYYFGPFEQYAENKINGNISSIDPQDDPWDEVSQKDSKNTLITLQKKNTFLKNKLETAKKEAVTFKKSPEFRKIKQELKEKKETNGKEEVSFKYLDLAVAGYVAPAPSNKFVGGPQSWTNCTGAVPCYKQFSAIYNKKNCDIGCVPTALAIIYGYHDRNGKPNLIPWTAPLTNNTTIDLLTKTLGDMMETFCENGVWLTYWTKSPLGIEYAKDKGYTNSTSSYLFDISTSTIFNKVKNEIDANRPIMLFNNEHAMVGFGYNSTSWLPIVRVNLWWWGTYKVDGYFWQYYASNIDYNINSIWYDGEHSVIKWYTTYNIQ